MSSRSGSSRRKPAQVSRAVFENSSDEDEDDAGNGKKVNGDSQSEEDIPEELPEGTVVVNPEPVEEKNPTFKGPEFVSGKRKSTGIVDASGLMARVTCTSCHKQINTNKKGSARRHPLLKVLICKRCRTYYDSGPIQKDKDGLDEQCRWCGEGGRLFGCDFCHNAFCRSCIIHNLGRSELMRVQNDDKWKCYVCNSKALRPQRHECEKVLEQIKKEEQKTKNALEREKEREKNREKKDTPSSKNTPSSKPNDTAKNTPSSKSSDSAKNTPSAKSGDTKQSIVKSTGGNIGGNNPKVELVVVGPKKPIQPKPMPMNMAPQQKPFLPAQQQLKNLLSMSSVPQQSVQQPLQRTMKQQLPMSNPVRGGAGFVSSLDPVSITLPMLIEEFKKNVTPITVPQVLSKLMNITNSLTLLMSSIKMNIMDNRINTPGFESINAMNLQSRKTAIDCLVSGLELFLQELQITTVGEYVPLPQKSEYNGANGSAADVSISNNSGIANDSEPEVVEIDSPTKMPKNLKMTKINDQIVVESDSDEDEIPVDKNVSQKVDVNKETNEKNSKTDEKNSKTVDKEIKEKPTDKEIKEKPTEDKLSDDEGMEVENTISKDEEDTTSKDDENTTGKDEDQEKLDKNSKEKSPKKQLNTGTESPKKAKKSSDEKEETVDSENTEAQLELLKELADELIKNGKKTDSESEDGNTECEDEDDDSKCENKEQSDEEETENVVKKEKNDKRKSESSTVKKGKDSKKKNVKEDEKDQSESENEEEDNQNKPVTSASSNDESDSDSENSDESGPRRRLRKRKAKKEDERSEKKGKGSLKIRLRLPTRSKSQQKDEKKSERRSSRSKTAEESQDSDDKDSRSKGKDKKGKAKKKSVESESENFDSDLEDEIDKLAKDPKVQKKKKKSEKEEEEEEKSKKGNKKGMKEEKDKKSKGKKEEKGDSDSSEGTDNYDPEEAAEDEDEEEEPMDTVDPLPDLSDKENSSTEVESGDGDSDDSSDSEVIINSPKKKKGGKSGSKKAKKSESSDSDAPKKKKRLRTKLLDAKLSESDDSDFQVSKKGKGKKRKAKTDSSEEQESTEEDSDAPTKKKGRGKRSAVSKQKGKKGKQTKRRRIKVASESSDEKMSTEGEEELKNEKKKKKKKKKDSSSEDGSDEDEDGEGSPSKGRKKIRKIKSDKKLTDTTRKAVKAEEERRKRIAEKQKQFNNVVVEDDPSSPTKCPITKQLVLEYDKETKEPLIEVDKRLITKLKPHQVEAAQFMWDCTIESLERTKKEKGAGCILAHCMGLGKTLSVITFLHTVMNHSDLTGVTKALVVGPLNTVLNWQHEFETWLSGELGEEFYEVFEISSVKQNVARANMLKHWHKNGGVMIIGYEMFRNLTQGNHCRSKKLKQVFREALVDPGPDICVCDEGHILKNDASAISKAMNQIVTLKRIVLTGTPLQNNLIEYHCMVNFVKPNLLGTRKEFSNRFVNPIVNGQCTDSSSHDVRLMKRRAHIIHEKLAGCVQRKDYSALTKFLSPKYEYVISVRLSKVQIELYQKYLDKTGSGNDVMGKGAKLFSDYQALMRIWTHPWVLKMDEVRQEKKAKWDDEDSFVDDGSMSEDESVSEPSKCSSSESDVVAISDNSSDEDVGPRKRRNSREAGSSKDTDEVVVNSKGEVVKKWTTRSRGGEGTEWEGIIKAAEEEQEERPLTTDWWADYVTEEDATRIELSGKLSLLFEILRMSEEIGDKVLVFSQSLLSLDLIENFLEHIDKKHQEEMEEKEKKRKEEEEKNKEDGNDDKEKDKDDKEKDKDDKEKDKDDKEKDKEDKEEEKKDGEATPEENVFGKQWTKGADYFRMDGSTSAQHRKDLAASFNDPENYRARLFIISTKAGGLGINLVAANRVIIFDASWNPSNDVQSVFRVYRFGQNKPVYIYRFLAQGTMEEKIYERQVTKQSLSQRVVDEHQIERHFTSHDLQVLYTFKPDRLDDPNREERQTPELPKDHMLAEMLQSHKEWICCYHKHDSLLENQLNEELTEEERKAAWKEFEEEKQGIANNVRQQFMGMNNFQGMAGAMGPNINMNMLMQQGLRLPAMGGMPGSNMPFNQQNLLQLVQDMKTRFPNLPEDQLTARVQGVIRHIITSQYMQQQEMQKRQLEQREMQHQQQLHQIQAQIQRQQQQLNAHQRMGSNFGQLPNNRR